MSIPTYDKFIEPLLRYLAEHPDGERASIVYEAAAEALGINEDDKLVLLPSRTQAVYKNRAGWAHDRLKRSGLSSSPRRGYWKLTDQGFAYAQSHRESLTEDEIKEVAAVDLSVRLRPLTEIDEDYEGRQLEQHSAQDSVATPDDRLESALTDLRETTAEDLLEAIGRNSPKFFEMLVLDLIHAMGYGASRADLQHAGRSGDGGIDGIISLDRLGLEKVFVQAKRWQNPVGPEAVQAFYGALEGRRANKGVFITTSSFTSGAVDFARLVEKIVLIDGARLTQLMMEYGVGVSPRLVKIPKIEATISRNRVHTSLMTLVKRISTLALTLLSAVVAGAQVPSLNERLTHSPAFAGGSVREYRRAHEHEILKEFLELLAIPNVASDRENIRRNATAIVTMMQRRKLQPRLLEASDPSAPPAVYGEWKTPGVTRTLILYAHYDGQPTDPNKWSGTLPWQPVLRSAALEAGGKLLPLPKANEAINPEWRLYARSASDDKAGVIAILTAFDALLASGVKPTSNLKFFFDGEEEAGSPHLGEILRLNKQLLQSDAWIICDGPVHQSGRKQVVFGVRGDTNVDITVYGAKRPLHSGHYGNWAPNPAFTLAQLLATMKDNSGRVTIAGWYDNLEPLGEAERRAIADAPRYDDTLRSELGLARTEGQGKSLLELINEPSLNINGISSGDVGALARNIIPTTATAVLDLRLVKNIDHRRQVQRLIDHIQKQGFYVIDREPTDEERTRYALIARVTQRAGGYNAERTRMDLPISLSVISAVQSTSEQAIVRLPTSGGSLPLSTITDNLTTVTMTVPIVNYDNNQHAENENLRLQNLWDGIETMAAIMTLK